MRLVTALHLSCWCMRLRDASCGVRRQGRRRCSQAFHWVRPRLHRARPGASIAMNLSVGTLQGNRPAALSRMLLKRHMGARSIWTHAPPLLVTVAEADASTPSGMPTPAARFSCNAVLFSCRLPRQLYAMGESGGDVGHGSSDDAVEVRLSA
ncbi:hypothetical protein TraAM80_00152 [Trypanosoma rangeli]|uniref:Uncharacterized protein n=1 Tax=Trypanosoma rangeli TaxID=5698 RepID=A0A422P503_TRYRA|nr:uncharacterized protein TraAM80_00152 [Trypanosoma rangeli]RNF12796.1 hypothetical protein TraAM80_00152 [Trypanosoma rangeli]|eukprot:RNF12796.1 hypothetical protein TraAM80_00152 [Trypanosoma rangeli]